MLYRPDAELSATEVIRILLNPDDPSQVLVKRIKQLASAITQNDVDREDLISEGYLYCAEVISDKWLQSPEGDGEPILTLSQMVRYLTKGMFLEKRIRIKNQNFSSQIEIKDNYALHLQQNQESEDLRAAGLSPNIEFETNHGRDAETWEQINHQDCSEGRTASGHKIFEADDFADKSISKVTWAKCKSLFLPKLSETEVLLFNQKIELDLSNEEIASIEGGTLANTVAQRWKRLKDKIFVILQEYEKYPQRIPKQSKDEVKPKAERNLIKTELIKVAIKHGILSHEVDLMLGMGK